MSRSRWRSRPGTAAGDYPERAAHEPPALARWIHAARGPFLTPRRISRDTVRRFAARVDEAAVGLCDLSEEAFDREVDALRRVFRRDGRTDSALPWSFAVVREAARRSLGMTHYDVQLFGGRVMAFGDIAELATGEGKTLTASLPAATAAMAGVPVHVLTANDYLVARDAEQMRPLFRRLGLRVGVVVEAETDRSARREAYACDITYVTNKQVAFDYLRDRIVRLGSTELRRRFAIPSDGGSNEAVLRGLCFAVVDEADSVLIDDACTPLILSRSGLPPDPALPEYALDIARDLEPGEHFLVDARNGTIDLTSSGIEEIESRKTSAPPAVSGRLRRTEWIVRALHALYLFQRDVHYLVHEGAVQTIDAATGRRSPDRSFEGSMQALLETKEAVPLSPGRETLARLGYQHFFRRYLRLCGMSGTAREVAGELWRVYGLASIAVPTRRPSKRSEAPMRVLSATDHAAAIVRRVRDLHLAGRPVLVGASDVDTAESVSGWLATAGLPHEVLSARQDAQEAAIVAAAGEPGRITVATRIAGRGTDIALGSGVEPRGGLAVVATDLAEARRIDRQLVGRCARQGQPGSAEQWISLEDRLLERHLPRWLRRRMSQLLPLTTLVNWLTVRAQHAEEKQKALLRLRTLRSEKALDDLLAFSGPGE